MANGMIFALLIILLSSGCHKQEPAAARENNGAIVPAQQSQATPPPAVAQRASNSSQENISATLARLTQAVRRFGVERRKAPGTLDEVVAAGYLSGLPAAPAGKKFVIDQEHLQVVLADR